MSVKGEDLSLGSSRHHDGLGNGIYSLDTSDGVYRGETRQEDDADLLSLTSSGEVGETAVEARGQTRNFRFVQGGFNPVRVVLDTIDNNGLLGTTMQSEIAGLINGTLVSRLEPAIAGEGLLGCSGVVGKVLEDDRAADLEVTDNASRNGLVVGSLGDSHIDTGHTSTDGGKLQRALLVVCWALGFEDETSACLSHTKTRNNDMDRGTALGQELRNNITGLDDVSLTSRGDVFQTAEVPIARAALRLQTLKGSTEYGKRLGANVRETRCLWVRLTFWRGLARKSGAWTWIWSLRAKRAWRWISTIAATWSRRIQSRKEGPSGSS